MAKAAAHGASVKSWQWFSRDHALAATLLCRRCAELEQDPNPPDEHDVARGLAWSADQAAEHRTYVVTAVMTSFAFIEAAVNELLESANIAGLEVGGDAGGLKDGERAALVDLREAWGGRGSSSLDRTQLILHLLRKTPFDKADAPYQQADVLRRLRNALVHYRPEWRAVGGRRGDDKITKDLSQLSLPLHPFTTSSHPFFPDRCLGYGLASWAWTTSLKFTDGFFERVGIEPIYNDLRPQLVLNPAG
jgi:hypothetical protein